jgi:hypothetical protein
MASERILEIKRRLERGKARLESLYGSVPPDGWERTVYEKPAVWTARDLLAHFVSVERSMLDLAKNLAKGGKGAPEGFDYDEYNRREQESYRKRSPQELMELFVESRNLTLKWLDGVTDEQLDRTGRHPGLGDVSLESVLASLHGHMLLHWKDLK